MIFQLASDLFWLLTILLCAVLIGRKLLSFFISTDSNRPLAKTLLSLGIGLGFLSCYIFLLGALELIYKNALMLSMAAFLLAGIGEFKSLLGNLHQIKNEFTASFKKKEELFYWVILLLAVLANFFYNYTPPTQGREMLYNLYLPKILLNHHQIIKYADEPNLTLYYPVLLEGIYTLAMGLRGDMVAKLIHYVFGIASALFIYEIVKRFFSSEPAALAATIVYLMPLTTSVSGTANVELGTTFYSIGAVYCLLLWIEKGSGFGEIALAGLMAGLCWQAKISGVSMVSTGLVFVFGWNTFAIKKPISSTLKVLSIFSLFVFIGISPWIVKNLILFGNPVYPFPIRSLGLQGHEQVALSIYNLNAQKLQYSFWDIVKMHNNIFLGDFIFGPGPLIFSFLLPGLWLDRQRNVKVVALLGFLFFLFHNLTFNSIFHRFSDTRFYLPVYALLAAVAAVGIERLKECAHQTLMVRCIVFLGLLFPCLPLSLAFGATKLPVFFGLETKESYIRKKLKNYDMFKFANRHLSDQSKVLVLGNIDPHWYYWEVPIIFPPLDLIKKKDRGEILFELKKNGVTHIIFSPSAFDYDTGSKIFRDPEAQGLDLYWNMEELRRRNLNELFRNRQAVLYEIINP